jgi:hypothetical protein
MGVMEAESTPGLFIHTTIAAATVLASNEATTVYEAATEAALTGEEERCLRTAAVMGVQTHPYCWLESREQQSK